MSYLLEMKSITKAFGAVKAVDNVSLRLNPGEVMSLCGENGSGKSTLMKVLCGIYPHGSYEGEIVFAGEVLQATHIRDTERKGIAIIHQELALVKHLTVLENIFLGAELSRHGVLDYDTMTLRCEKLLAQVSLAISPDTRVGDLGLGQQQLVEIAKALNNAGTPADPRRANRLTHRTGNRRSAQYHPRPAKPRYRLHLYFAQAQ